MAVIRHLEYWPPFLCSLFSYLSDIFGVLSGTDMSTRTLGAVANGCTVLALSWSCPFLNCSSSVPLVVDDVTGRLINYTLTFSGVENLKNWTVQLNSTTTSYNITGRQVLGGEEYFLRLKVDAVLQNGSYYHLTSQAFCVIMPDCSGKTIYY